MAHSSSNAHYDTRLDVTLLPHDPGFKPSLSIASTHFQQPNLVELMRGDDQQIIDLETIVREFAHDGFFTSDQKVLVAKHLENLATLIRRIVAERHHQRQIGSG